LKVDEFLEVQSSKKGPGTVGWWVRARADLGPDRWQQLEDAADNPAISHRTISVVLERWGVKVTPGMVGHWRRNVR
jgi:hypothetical protein